MNPRPARGTVFDTLEPPQNAPFSAPKTPLRAYQNRTGRPGGEGGLHFPALGVPREENRILSKPEPSFMGIPRAERTRDETGRRYPFKGPLACLLRRRARVTHTGLLSSPQNGGAKARRDGTSLKHLRVSPPAASERPYGGNVPNVPTSRPL